MKFRKSPASRSPKMELLLRRSSGSRMSTLKRSRSFRASVKLMSKIRNHANLRLTTGYDLSSVSKDFAAKKERNIHTVEEIPSSGDPSEDSVDTNPRGRDKDDDGEVSSSPRKISMPATDVDPNTIAKDLKSKLSLADRIMGKSRKNADKPLTKDEGAMSPKVVRIFRKKHSAQEDKTRRKNCGDKRVSYENPVFVLDSSLDSSVSSFFFEETAEEEEDEKQRPKRKERERVPAFGEQDVLTVIVDSHKTASNRNANYEEDEECFENEETRNAFRPRCETSPCELRSENSQSNAINLSRRTAESFGGYDRSRVKMYCKVHETGKRSVVNYLQDQNFLDTVKTCPSKSCRTVDNIANFWASRRGNSFRSKMAIGRKRDAKEAKNHERVDQERVLVSTSSGSSMLDQ